MIKKRFILFFLLGFLFFACTSKAPPRVAIPDENQKTILQNASLYMHSLHRIGTVKAYAKVRLKVRGYEGRFEEVLKIQFPSSFYFETLDDFANTRFQLLSDGALLYWQNFDKKEYWEGELNEKTIRRFLPLASNLEETLGLFIGKLPELDLKEAQVFQGKFPQLFVIKIPRGELVWDNEIHAIVSLVLKAESANLAFEYEGKNFHSRTLFPTKETDVYLPSRVRLKDLKTKNEIEINYQNFELGIGSLMMPSPIKFNPLPDAKKLHDLP